MNARSVLGVAVVFSVAMGALSSGGWWWAVLAVLAVPLLSGRVRLPMLGRVRLDPITRLIIRENARTRRENHRIRRERRRRIRDHRRAIRKRRRQAQ
ncbi:MAG: hypothetical protein ACT4NP_00200 [Pseudonocardiales bacterium]